MTPGVEEISDFILWLEDGAIRDRKADQHEWVHDPVCGLPVDVWTSDLRYHYGVNEYLFALSDACNVYQRSRRDTLLHLTHQKNRNN